MIGVPFCGSLWTSYDSVYKFPKEERGRKRIYYYGSLQICEQQSVFLWVSARYKDERRQQAIFIMSFSQGFLPSYRQQSKDKVYRVYTRFSEIFL